MHEGRSPSMREIMTNLGYKSPRSAQLILEQLEELGLIRRINGQLTLMGSKVQNRHIDTVEIPLVGTVACGNPILAEENIQGTFRISTGLAKPPDRYFFLRAQGNSMNQRGISQGSFLLVRQQQTAANGDIVVALIDDRATVKELRILNDAYMLLPRSDDPTHKPIILSEDFAIQGVVIKIFEDFESLA